MTAVTLGPEGTYSHRAAQSIADTDAIDFRQSVTSIVDAVASTAQGVVAGVGHRANAESRSRLENIAENGRVRRLESHDTEHVVE